MNPDFAYHFRRPRISMKERLEEPATRKLEGRALKNGKGGF